jgi:hypothetical protein
MMYYHKAPAKEPDNQKNKPKESAAEPKKAPAPRLNPRLVFTDPDAFFSDLLMEQQEQG